MDHHHTVKLPMRHELPFEHWLMEVKSLANSNALIIIVLAEDVHDDWACGTAPEDVVDRIAEGRHRNFRKASAELPHVRVSSRTPAAYQESVTTATAHRE